MKVLVLDSEEIPSLVSMKECVEEIRCAFVLLRDGRVQMPPRTRLDLGERGQILFMPSLVAGRQSLVTLKAVSVYPKSKNGPATKATVLLIDGSSGELKAIIDGTTLTSLRTGAVSGLSCRYLARADSHVVGIIGAGGQAFQQINGVASQLNLEKVLVFSRRKAGSLRLASEVSKKLDVEGVACDSAEESVRDADVVITATTSNRPVVSGTMVRDGTHVIAIGSFTKEAREVDTALVKRASVYVDLLEAAMNEAGDIAIPMKEGAVKKNHVKGDLVGLVNGYVRGRRAPDEVTFFKSVGVALEDTAAAGLAYRKAVSRRIGRWLEI